MRRNAALYTLLVAELVVAALSIAFHLKTRVAVVEAFGAYDTAVPAVTRIALAPWLLPSAVVVAALLTGGALLAPIRRSTRMAILSVALVLSSFALVFAVLGAFAPIFRPG